MGNRGRILITGGAGFVGSNLAHSYLADGYSVTIFDNFSRAGVEQNWEWLSSQHSSKVRLIRADVEDEAAVAAAVKNADFVFHFAAQVAVTTSLLDPLGDFGTNVRGTLNVLEAVRKAPRAPGILYTSTNKVYGSLSDVAMRKGKSRYEPESENLRSTGVDETKPLEFHSPYGCSKGAADQYVLDYARCYGLRSIVFRMSCIYGPRQCGTEDQGWVAHFLMRALHGEPVTIYGDGMQVRDILYVDDLLNAFRLAMSYMDQVRGQAFNIGGSPAHTISLLELVGVMEDLLGAKPDVRFAKWRKGDQRYYVSDIRKFRQATGWQPTVAVKDGVSRLHQWLAAHHEPHAILTAQS